MPANTTEATNTIEFGYWPERQTGIVERRRRPKRGMLWSEIERLGHARFVVRSQFGTQHPDEFSTITEAVEVAKDLSFCPVVQAELGLKPSVHVRLPRDLAGYLNHLAGEQGVSLNALLATLIAGAVGWSLDDERSGRARGESSATGGQSDAAAAK
jgi:hypothetical protein